MINWNVRFKNKQFWLSLIPAVLLFLQAVLKPLNCIFNLERLNGELVDIVNAVFLILTIIGVVNDPTTDSLTDSSQALTYKEPRKD